MIVQYRLDDLYIIRISSKKYYYGNGEDINALSFSPNTFLRFNPYLKDADYKTPIPNKIKKWIKSHSNVPTTEARVLGEAL